MTWEVWWFDPNPHLVTFVLHPILRPKWHTRPYRRSKNLGNFVLQGALVIILTAALCNFERRIFNDLTFRAFSTYQRFNQSSPLLSHFDQITVNVEYAVFFRQLDVGINGQVDSRTTRAITEKSKMIEACHHQCSLGTSKTYSHHRQRNWNFSTKKQDEKVFLLLCTKALKMIEESSREKSC